MRFLAALSFAWRLRSPSARPVTAAAQAPSTHAIDIPPWFAETFLDFRDDVRDAAKDDKRLMVYFGQDGCPYCTQLMTTNFSQQRIVEKTRRHFVAIALNIWGDREVTWVDGRTMSEKALARALKVQFTPTLLFLDERGAIVARVNGYYPPHRFEAALDYVAGQDGVEAQRSPSTCGRPGPTPRARRWPTSRSSSSRRTICGASPARSRSR